MWKLLFFSEWPGAPEKLSDEFPPTPLCLAKLVIALARLEAQRRAPDVWRQNSMGKSKGRSARMSRVPEEVLGSKVIGSVGYVTPYVSHDSWGVSKWPPEKNWQNMSWNYHPVTITMNFGRRGWSLNRVGKKHPWDRYDIPNILKLTNRN